MKLHAPVERIPTKYTELDARMKALTSEMYLPIECEDRIERKQVWDHLMWKHPDLVVKQHGLWLWIRKGDFDNGTTNKR